MSAPTLYKSRGVYTRTKGEPPGGDRTASGWPSLRVDAAGLMRVAEPAAGVRQPEAKAKPDSQRTLKPASPLPFRQQGFPEPWIVEE